MICAHVLQTNDNILLEMRHSLVAQFPFGINNNPNSLIICSSPNYTDLTKRKSLSEKSEIMLILVMAMMIYQGLYTL